MGLPFPQGGAAGFWAVYQGPLAALAASLLVVLLGRLTRGRWTPAAAGALVGWAALVPASTLLRAVLMPPTLVARLLLPALLAVALGFLLPVLRGRAVRWAPALVLAAAGWWLAGSPAGRGEFWRVWAAVGLGGWLLSRAVRNEPARAMAAALALWAGLVVAGAPPVWIVAALVLVAASVALLGGRLALPPVLVVVAAAAASLGAGRLVRAGLNGVDAAALATLAAPWMVPVLGVRLSGRLGRAGPVLAVPAAAALAAGVVWCVARLLRS